MAKKTQTKATHTRKSGGRAARPATVAADALAARSAIPPELQEFLAHPAAPQGFVNRTPVSPEDLRRRLIDRGVRLTVSPDRLLASVNRVKPAAVPEEKLRLDIRSSVRALKPTLRRFHGAKLSLSWFPFPWLISSCADRFGYMSSAASEPPRNCHSTPRCKSSSATSAT